VKTLTLYAAALHDRRRAWIWWSIALVMTLVMIAASYGAIEGQEELNQSLQEIPESLRVLMGIDEELTLTSPAGYLNSQWFANFFPILLSIYGIGLAARFIAGEEGDGRLEVVLSYPIARLRVLGERGWAVLTLLVALFVMPSAVLVVTSSGFGMDGIGAAELSAASASSLLLALLHTAATYGVGAWTGRRGVAIAVGAGVTGGGFLVQSLANISDTLRPVRWLSPWHWFIDARPIVDGWSGMLLPSVGTLALCAVFVAAGAARFRARDIGTA
jgi:ABC-2 type transport system permease protein